MSKGVLIDHLQCGCHETCSGHKSTNQENSKLTYLDILLIIVASIIAGIAIGEAFL